MAQNITIVTLQVGVKIFLKNSDGCYLIVRRSPVKYPGIKGEWDIVRLSYTGQTSGEPVLDTSDNIEYKWVSFSELRSHENLDIYVKEIIDKGYLKE